MHTYTLELYTLLREFADSWMLLALFSFFVGVILWVLRPGSRSTYADTASIPFRNEQAPGHTEANAAKEA